MQAIRCELCGSNDFKKENGEYVCQYCHTKYTPEEAKKLIIEGVVDVKIDTSKQQKNYEKLAERSFKDELYDQAYDYYNKLLEIDSDNWKYVYKKGLCAAWQSTLANFRIDEAIKACKNAFNIIEINEVKIDNKEEICYQMADDINKVSVAFYFLAQNHYNEFWTLSSAAQEYIDQIKKCISCEEYASEIIKDFINDNTRDKELYIKILRNIVIYYVEICKKRRYKSGSNQYGDIYDWVYCKDEYRKSYIEKYDQCVAELKKLEPTYNPPFIERQKPNSNGCYVATCVYGSYDCPEVWILRRYRDYYLRDRVWGRAFIKVYYLISPKIVELVGKTKWFNTINKSILDRIIKKLKNKGYKDSKYQDLY